VHSAEVCLNRGHLVNLIVAGLLKFMYISPKKGKGSKKGASLWSTYDLRILGEMASIR